MYSGGTMYGGGGGGGGRGADGYDMTAGAHKRQRLDHHHHQGGSSYFSGSPLQAGLGLYGGGNGGGGGPAVSGGFGSGYFGAPHANSSWGGGGGQQLPVVRLRGLPFDCAESDVLEFFAGLDVVDVLLAHKQGRFTGEAYCLLAAPMQVDLALHRHKQNMGRRYIEVFRSKKQEYYKAVAAEVADSKTSEKERGDNNRGERREERGNTNNNTRKPPPPPSAKAASEKEDAEHTGVLKLRGLPFSASASDVLEFFSGYDLSDENVHIVTRSGGRASGEAYVEFKSPEDSKAAMSKDNMMMGSRYIELFPSSREEALKVSSK